MHRAFSRLLLPTTLGIAVCALGLKPDPLRAQDVPAVRRPNVLLILGDDHAAYALGCYGSPVARTPNLDRFAKEGTLFTRAYCNSPVCTPSRQSFLTGRMPHAVGVTQLSTPLPDAEVTLAEQLRAAGYETGAIGKMHFNSQSRHGFDVRIDRPEHQRSLRQKTATAIPPNLPTLGPFKPFQDPSEVWLNAEQRPFPAYDADMDATFYAREAARFLQRPHSQPFFLAASFYQPHSPFQFPIEYSGRYRPEKMPVPKVGSEDGPQVPLIFRQLTDRQKQGINASYYTAVEYLDSKVGAVLDALRESGREKDTLVIYASDHGYNLGHHGRFEKHCFYETAVRAPLIVRWPGQVRAGKRSEAMVELVDLFPTVTEACGVPLPPERHGRSLLPVLTGSAGRGRDHVVSLYFENEEAMVRTPDWKLIYCTGKRARQDGYVTENPTPGRYVRLYNLDRDPGEFKDLAGEPEQADRVRELKRLLLARIDATAPADLKAPDTLISVDEKLDWYLVPPEVRRASR